MEVQILPPKPEAVVSGQASVVSRTPFDDSRLTTFPERSADGYTGLFWKQVFAGSNPAALTNFSARVAKSAKAPVLETGY